MTFEDWYGGLNASGMDVLQYKRIAERSWLASRQSLLDQLQGGEMVEKVASAMVDAEEYLSYESPEWKVLAKAALTTIQQALGE